MGIKKDAFFRHMVRVAVVTNNQAVLNEFETALAHAAGNPVKAIAEILMKPDNFPALIQEATQKFKLDKIPEWMQLAKAYSVEALRPHLERGQDDIQKALEEARAGRPPLPRAATEKTAELIPPDTFMTIMRREAIELYNIIMKNREEVRLLHTVLGDTAINIADKVNRVKGILLRAVLLDYMSERQKSRQMSKGLKEASVIKKDMIYRVMMSHLDFLDVRK